MMDFKIRQAGSADIPAIYRLVLDATRRGKILRRSRSDIAKSVHHFWVAEEDGRLIACCALEVYSRRIAEIRSLVVLPKFRGQGVAKNLITRCLARAKKKKILEILIKRRLL